MNASPSREPPLVFRYMPARGPVRISAYCWPSTGLVVSFSDADFSALEKEVVVPVDLSEVDLAWAAWFAAAMPWRRDVSTRIGLFTPSTIRPHTFSPDVVHRCDERDRPPPGRLVARSGRRDPPPDR